MNKLSLLAVSVLGVGMGVLIISRRSKPLGRIVESRWDPSSTTYQKVGTTTAKRRAKAALARHLSEKESWRDYYWESAGEAGTDQESEAVQDEIGRLTDKYRYPSSSRPPRAGTTATVKRRAKAALAQYLYRSDWSDVYESFPFSDEMTDREREAVDDEINSLATKYQRALTKPARAKAP